MNRHNLADKVRNLDNCNYLGDTELEGAGQHYIEMGVFAHNIEETLRTLEDLTDGTDWRVDNYEDKEGPYFYSPDQGDKEEGNIRLKKNTWNEHQV